MRRETWKPLLSVAMVAVLGCSKEPSPSGAAPSSSAAAAPSLSAPAPSASASPSTSPSAAASAAEPPHECPGGSTGVGSFSKPCDAKGASRLMEIKWTKTGDSGPSFSIKNKSQLVVVYGKIAVYFYDKAGKQLEVKDETANPPQRPYHTCAGKFFGGVMNPGEKAVLTFSCVPKSVVPEGTASIEAEMQWVGFADASGKKIDFYWRNNDLVPDKRPKGGVT